MDKVSDTSAEQKLFKPKPNYRARVLGVLTVVAALAGWEGKKLSNSIHEDHAGTSALVENTRQYTGGVILAKRSDAEPPSDWREIAERQARLAEAHADEPRQ